MRAHYAVLYITLGIALGLCLHVMINPRGAEAEWAAPSSTPPRAVDTAYA